MILNDTVPCRLTRTTLAPLCALTLGLFAMPTFAQGAKKSTPPEIRVNGKRVSELSAKERAALLDALQPHEETTEEPKAPPQPEPKKVVRVRTVPVETEEVPLFEERKLVEGKKLRTHEVKVGSLLNGIGELAIVEIAKDPDVRKLGIGEDLALVIRGALRSEDVTEGLGSLIGKAMKHALVEVGHELRSDKDLVELRIGSDVGRVVEGFSLDGSGSDLTKTIGTLVQKAIGSALRSEDAPAKPRKKVKVEGMPLERIEVEGMPLEHVEVRGEPLQIEIREVTGEPFAPKPKSKRKVEIR